MPPSATATHPIPLWSRSAPRCRAAVRRFLKFLHTIGAIGFMGSIACMLVLLTLPASLRAGAGYPAIATALAALATWIFLPALGLTLISGLLAIAFTEAFHNAGWAWLKLATGILIFEGFLRVQGALQDDAAHAAGLADGATLGGPLQAEVYTLWLLLVVAGINVGLGIWRPRLSRGRG